VPSLDGRSNFALQPISLEEVGLVRADRASGRKSSKRVQGGEALMSGDISCDWFPTQNLADVIRSFTLPEQESVSRFIEFKAENIAIVRP
jgi:hypothetical protein